MRRDEMTKGFVGSVFAFAVVSCGESKISTLKSNEASALTVKSEILEKRDTISQGVVSVHAAVNGSIDPLKNNVGGDVLFTLSVPSGEKKVEKRSGSSIDWSFKPEYGDGEYSLQVEIFDAVKRGFTNVKPWNKKFRVDTTPPKMAVAMELKSESDSTGRTVDVRVNVENETDVACTGVLSPNLAGNKEEPINFELVSSSVPGTTGGNLMVASGVRLPDQFPNAVVAKVSCIDSVGNTSEAYDAASFEQPGFNLAAEILGSSGFPYESLSTPSPTKYVFARTGTSPAGSGTLIKLKNDLIEKKSLKPASMAVVDREKSLLRLYVSDVEVTNLSALENLKNTNHVLLGKTFAPSLEVILPATILGPTKLWVTLTQYRDDVADKTAKSSTQEIFVGSVPVFVYVEEGGKGLDAQFVSPSMFVPATSGATIAQEIVLKPIDGKGATRSGFPIVQYSLNNSSWQDIEAKNWSSVSGKADTYSFQISYPFAEEKPFRLRLKATDLAGNETISAVSKNIVGPSSLAPSNVCAGSGLKVALSSSFLCKKKVDGIERYFALIVAQNVGNAALDLSKAVACSNSSSVVSTAGSVETSSTQTSSCWNVSTVRGTGVFTEKVVVDSMKAPSFVNFEKVGILFGSFEKGEYAKKTPLSVTFADYAPTGNCIANAPAVPVVNLKSVPLSEGPFDCDE